MISSREADIRKMVLLGATGRLGRMLRAYWPGTAPIAVGRRAGPDVIRMDIASDTDGLQGLIFSNRGPVVCLAGVTPGAPHDGGDLSQNTVLALNAIRAAAGGGGGRVFLASSAAVYGRQSDVLSEAAPRKPISAYGEAKSDMEVQALALGEALGHPVTILRIGNVAGADAILGGWQRGMSLDVFPDGLTPRRSYIGPAALAGIIAGLTAQPDLPPVLNVSARGVVAMGDLLDAAELPWTRRVAPDAAIPQVVLCTQTLARYVDVPKVNAADLVASWQEYRMLHP